MTYKLTHKDFYEGLKQGKLLGLKCNNCGGWTCPPKINCSQCTGMDLEVKELSGKGEIKTFTVIRVAPEGMETEAPYIVAMAEMEEGPWLTGNIIGVDPEKVNMDIIGSKVKVGHKTIPPANYTAGEGVAITFTLSS